MEKLIIGITGGIGSGKTTFAKILVSKGFDVIFTDDLAKKIINENAEVRKKLISAFGTEAFIGGIYNTSYISSIVFSNRAMLEKLNDIIFPFVVDLLIKEIDLLQNFEDKKRNFENNSGNFENSSGNFENKKRIIFVESALLYEFGLENGFDYIISVSASLENRIKRIKNRDKLSEQDIKNRIFSQISQEDKNKLADFVVENDNFMIEEENFMIELEKSADFLTNLLPYLPNKGEEF